MNLNVHLKTWGSLKVIRESSPQKRKVNSLQEVNKIVSAEDFKNIHYRVLDFLKEVYAKTKIVTQAGAISLTEIRNNHRVNPALNAHLQRAGILKVLSHGSTKPIYKWDSVPPTMHMVQKLLEDIKKENDASNKTTLVAVHKPEHEEQHEEKAPQIIHHLIDYDLICERIIAAIPPPVQPQPTDLSPMMNHVKKELHKTAEQLHLSTVSWLQHHLPAMISQEVARLQPEVKIIEVPKTTHVEHHHYVEKEEKQNMITKWFAKK